MSAPYCLTCHDMGHVCENHRDRPWPGITGGPDCCGGAGEPCPDCCTPTALDRLGSVEAAFIPDHLRGPVWPVDGPPGAGR